MAVPAQRDALPPADAHPRQSLPQLLRADLRGAARRPRHDALRRRHGQQRLGLGQHLGRIVQPAVRRPDRLQPRGSARGAGSGPAPGLGDVTAPVHRDGHGEQRHLRDEQQQRQQQQQSHASGKHRSAASSRIETALPGCHLYIFIAHS